MKILIFGGTSEGRELSECLCQNQIQHTLCVATEYGEEVLEHSEYAKVLQGRLDAEQMKTLFEKEAYTAVVDATHPYAVEVSKNIRNACEALSVTYLRFLRQQKGNLPKDSILVGSASEAAEYLETQKGIIFLTTGSKELPRFWEKINDHSRLFARVLPSAEVISACRSLGLEGKQICAMQGPFSEEMNQALLKQTQASFLVTKDTGETGGFPEKVSAAEKLGVRLVVIRRPDENGMNKKDVLHALEELLGRTIQASNSEAAEEIQTAEIRNTENKTDHSSTVLKENRQISCIGIGMGTLETLTHGAAEEIRNAQILFGAKRMIESVQNMAGVIQKNQVLIDEYRPSEIAEYLKEYPQYTKIVILMSGDVGFYSGARLVQDAFPNEKLEFYCGISSVVYFASKVPTPWQDAALLSAHGRSLHLLNCVQRYPKIIMLVSGAEDVQRICRELCDAEMNDVRVTVGTNLSYPEEQISAGAPEKFLVTETKGLHIMMIENPAAHHVIVPGMPDETFVRGKVPMTKEEIRILSVAKLQLTEDAVVYDIGAGTGSVSMECARLCTKGEVYAIERNPEGIALIQENSRQLHLSNVIPVEGLAPDAMEDLPAPTHAFIGGSAGNMDRILDLLKEKNPNVRIVINTIALESISEVMQILKERGMDADIVQISAAKSRVLGKYHMMTGLNPVYIITID